MQRVKNVAYDEGDVYDDENEYQDEEQGYTAEDRENFATLTPVVRAGLEEAGLQASDREIEESLWHYYWDVGKSVTYLKNAKQPKPQQQAPRKEKTKSKFDEAAERSANKAGALKSNEATNVLAKKTESLQLQPSEGVAPTNQLKVRNKGLDVPKLWAEEKTNRRPSAAFVVIGHVDHGKSTLMGRLLLDTGAVPQRDIDRYILGFPHFFKPGAELDRYKKQAAELGKASFALAWVMDTGSEERERGVTVDIAQHHFSTGRVDFTILDAPGHRDFVPNMIGGASMAELALLVVDANQLESGLKGQTREHIMLAKAVGMKRVVVAVNKIDATSPPWSRDVFMKVSTEVRKLLGEAGFAAIDVAVTACSGLSGENVVKPPSSKGALAWMLDGLGPLVKELEHYIPSPPGSEVIRQPLRMQIGDVFRGGITNPLSVAGRISTGNVQVGDVVTIQPSGEAATIKGIEVGGEGRDWAVTAQICTMHLQDIDPQHLRAGDMLCSSAHPVPVTNSFTAKVKAWASLLPQDVDVHFGRLHVPGRISQLVATLDKGGEVLKKKPKVVKESQSANVRVTIDNVAPLEIGDRVVMRTAGSTVAAGVVEHTGS